jgi:processing peptidase subunit beta
VLKQDVPKSVELLADILQNSLLDSASVEVEKNIILREKAEVEKLPTEVLFDHLHATAFQHTSLGRSILGLSTNISNMTKADLQAYIKTHYSAGRMVVVGAGAVDHDSFVKMADKVLRSATLQLPRARTLCLLPLAVAYLSPAPSTGRQCPLEQGSVVGCTSRAEWRASGDGSQAFKSLPKTTVTAKEMAAASPAAFTGSDVRFRDDDLGKCYLAISVQGASWTDPDAVTLMVMQTMLGSWDAVRTSPPCSSRRPPVCPSAPHWVLVRGIRAVGVHNTHTHQWQGLWPCVDVGTAGWRGSRSPQRA